MRKLMVLLLFSWHSLCAQQHTIIEDSVVRTILDKFINELDLEHQKFRMIIIELTSFQMRSSINRIDTVQTGSLTGVKLQMLDYPSYSFNLFYEMSSEAIDRRRASYFSMYRNIPVLISFGFENLLKVNNRRHRKLRRNIAKHTNPHILARPIKWSVQVENKRFTIEKFH